MTSTQLRIHQTRRFEDAFGSASVESRHLIVGAVHDFVWRYRSDPRTVLRQYDTISGLNAPVRKADVSGGDRLLFHYENGTLLLLDVGPHHVTERYTLNKWGTDYGQTRPGLKRFYPEQSGFFRDATSDEIPFHFEDEPNPEWVYYLDKRQSQVEKKIRNRTFKTVGYDGAMEPVFIVGGPGTGKTCVLLQLYDYFHDLVECRVSMSIPLMEFIEQCTKVRLGENRLTFRERLNGTGDVWYVDDPSSAVEIRSYLQDHLKGKCKSLVIAFDPLQLDDAMDDGEYYQMIRDYGVKVYHLDACYRQKENLGSNTLHVVNMIAASTPFLADNKIADFRRSRSEVTALSNELRFVNPSGYVKSYSDTNVSDISYEVQRILRYKWLMWDYAPGLLVIEGLKEGYCLSDASNDALSPLEAVGYIKWIDISRITSVKGLEFQHVFVFMDKDTYQEVNQGFRGTGQRVYKERRLLRIPFSRARDSLVTFAM